MLRRYNELKETIKYTANKAHKDIKAGMRKLHEEMSELKNLVMLSEIFIGKPH